MTLEWQNQQYEVPTTEPPQDRDPLELDSLFRQLLVAYVNFAQGFTPHELRIGECRRSLERQVWLYAQGRVNAKRKRSWTIDSWHRVGLAADLIMVDVSTNEAVWDEEDWIDMYSKAPPEWFGLRTIPQEKVHLEHAAAADIANRGDELSIVWT